VLTGEGEAAVLLLILKDGTHLEVPQAVDVIHKLGYIVCVDQLDMPVMTLPVNDVIAYTRNDRLAEELGATEEDATDEGQSDVTQRRRRMKRRAKATEFAPHDLPMLAENHGSTTIL
jgi:hypothetical protein